MRDIALAHKAGNLADAMLDQAMPDKEGTQPVDKSQLALRASLVAVNAQKIGRVALDLDKHTTVTARVKVTELFA